MSSPPRPPRFDTQDQSDLEVSIATESTEGVSELSELSEPKGLSGLVGRLFRLPWVGSEPVDHDRGRELRRAVRSEDLARVKKMLRDGVGVNESQEASLACIATRRQNLALLEMLIQAGVDLDQGDRRNRASRSRTPLQEAARKGWLDGVDALLAAGARVDVEDEVGATALLLAVRSGRLTCARRLLEAGANPEGSPKARMSPLHESSTPEMAAVLIEAGATVEQRDLSGATPLHHQARAGRPVMVEFLLSKGAPVDALDSRGRSPLFFCGGKGDAQATFEKLLAAGANTSIRDDEANSFIHLAATRCHASRVLEALYLQTPDLWVLKNKSGETALDIVQARGFLDLAERIQRDAAIREKKADVSEARRYNIFDASKD